MKTPISLRAILGTSASLLALAALSFGFSYVDLGGAALPLAIAIGAAKAALVGAFFMELVKESASIRLAVASGAALAVVLVGLLVADVLTR